MHLLAAVDALHASVDDVHALAFRLTGSREQAEQATDATFTRLRRDLDGPGRSGALLAVAVDEALRSARRARSCRPSPRTARALDHLAAQLAADEELSSLLRGDARLRRIEATRAALVSLRPEHARALALRHVAGLDLAAAARAAGAPERVFALTLRAARRTLRRAVRARTETDAVGRLRELGRAGVPAPRAVFVAAVEDRLVTLAAVIAELELTPDAVTRRRREVAVVPVAILVALVVGTLLLALALDRSPASSIRPQGLQADVATPSSS